MNNNHCAWHVWYYPGEKPPQVTGCNGSHGMCERCCEHFLDGEGPRWQVWEARDGLKLPAVVAMPAHLDCGRVVTYRVRNLDGAGGDRMMAAATLDGFYKFGGRVLEEA